MDIENSTVSGTLQYSDRVADRFAQKLLMGSRALQALCQLSPLNTQRAREDQRNGIELSITTQAGDFARTARSRDPSKRKLPSPCHRPPWV